MKTLLISLMLFCAGLATAQPAASQAGSQPALDFLRRLVGGTWTGAVGALPVSIRYEAIFDGKVVEGKGTVGDPAKPVLRMLSRNGVDPATGTVYYVDLHNADTIFFGHATIEKDVWKCDFKSIAGGDGHWVNYGKLVDADTFESSLYQIGADGKEKLVHKMVLKRTKANAAAAPLN